jgi:predicted enzyme related to lactoylglutathione lyase
MSTIVHFDVPVDDIKRAKDFYEKLFDWPGFIAACYSLQY